MADYNSPYTGAEVDAAVAKTDEISKLVQVYSGAPTNTGVEMSTISINPDTEDRTGTYDVIFSKDNFPINSSGSHVYLSRMIVTNEGSEAIGTSHVHMSVDTIKSQNANYAGATIEKFIALSFEHAFNTDSSTESQIYIHEIYRLEKI